VLASVTSEAFIAYSLQFGNTYTFKVESKNSYGYSQHSEPLEMLCAFRPDAPEAPSTEVQGNQVLISWDEAVNNGAEITGYKLFIQ